MASAEIIERFEPLDMLTKDEPNFVYARDVLLEQELRAKAISEYYEVVPTIGCEVEVQWSTLFPADADEFFGLRDETGSRRYTYRTLPPERRRAFFARCAELDPQLKPRFEATRIAGIPSMPDAYWEFAQRPAYHWDTLATETQLLMHSGLIPESYQHSLHVTLGGLALGRGGVNMLIPGLELVAGTPERIVAATQTASNGRRISWDRKGSQGVRERLSTELEFGAKTAVELRSLVAIDRQQVATTLRVAQMLGAVLLSKRNCTIRPSSLASHLAGHWPDYIGVMHELFDAHNLPTKHSWGNPADYKTRWLTWAACIQRREVPDTYEAEVVQKIMQIVRDVEEALEVVIC